MESGPRAEKAYEFTWHLGPGTEKPYELIWNLITDLETREKQNVGKTRGYPDIRGKLDIWENRGTRDSRKS